MSISIGFGSVDIVFSGETTADTWIEKEVRNVVAILYKSYKFWMLLHYSEAQAQEK